MSVQTSLRAPHLFFYLYTILLFHIPQLKLFIHLFITIMNIHFYLKLLFSLKITKINKVTCEELIN
jgi:hypothetical protein